MNIGAYIFLVIFGLSTVQPLVTVPKAETVKCCTKSREKKACHKQAAPKKKKECGSSNCNPFMACAYGNFYFAASFQLNLLSPAISNQKNPLVNDNRTVANAYEYWQPPESDKPQAISCRL